MTIESFVRQLAREAKSLGSQTKLAKNIGCSVQYLSDVLRGRLAPGKLILDHYGYKIVKSVVRKG